jgi:hypothetical protein
MAWNSEPSRMTLFDHFRTVNAAARGELRDEVEDFVGRSGLFDADDLIKLMKAGYRQLPGKQKGEFMRRVLFELKKSEHP